MSKLHIRCASSLGIRNIILHEFAHVLVPPDVERAHHGPIWKKTNEQLGGDPLVVSDRDHYMGNYMSVCRTCNTRWDYFRKPRRITCSNCPGTLIHKKVDKSERDTDHETREAMTEDITALTLPVPKCLALLRPPV
jgi:predicted SprT family Zn-dependent metalloprotease